MKRTSKKAPPHPLVRVAGKNFVKTPQGLRRIAQGSPGAELGTIAAAGSMSAGSISMSPLFYDYRYSTPDKFYFPRDRAQANSIWRDMYRRDATIAITTDMYTQLPWSKFDLEGIDDSAIRHIYEDMFTDLNLLPKLESFTRDFLITGELILHQIFNSTKGYWERVISHNPDYVRVQGLGLAVEQPLLWLKPTPDMRRLAMSPDPRVRKFLEVLPREMVTAIRMNRELPLDALNTTYIPRLNTSNDPRGTSLYTRTYRIVMYEDFVTNASLAVAQRNAVPVRMFKLGAEDNSWMPGNDDLDSFAEMLSLAETDPMAAIIVPHPHVSVEYIGASDRMLLISREWDFIERVKLLAMGVSKSFLIGETSFAVAIAGLQNLMERLNSLRYKFEQEWMIPKLCKTVAEMHEFVEKPKKDLEHRIKIKRPNQEKLIVPKIKWYKSLEPTQDASVLGVWRDLHDKGFLSERTYASGAGVDLEVERRNISEEAEYKKKVGTPAGTPGADLGSGAELGGGVPPPPPPPAGPPAEGASLHRRQGGNGRDRDFDGVSQKFLENLAKDVKEGRVNEEQFLERLNSFNPRGHKQLAGASPEYSGRY